MAEIYTQHGEEITVGLQGSAICDEAMLAAQRIAAQRGETVRLVDGDDEWDVHPDGSYEVAEPWPSMLDEDKDDSDD